MTLWYEYTLLTENFLSTLKCIKDQNLTFTMLIHIYMYTVQCAWLEPRGPAIGIILEHHKENQSNYKE